MKKFFLFVLLLALPLLVSAYDIKVENADDVTIYYNYIKNGTELEVVGAQQVAVVNIPEEVTYMGRTRKVTSIGQTAFFGRSYITSVTIPNTVTTIGDQAFGDCSSLTSVIIPNSVNTIGEHAFESCSLTSVTIPNSVNSIGRYAFNWCKDLASITVEKGNTKYDSRNNCNAIIETNSNTLIFGCMNTIIPNSVTSIGESAFQGSTGLTSITIPNSVTAIGSVAFSGCSGLTSVTIPNSVTKIGYEAFDGCRGLTSVSFHCKEIGDWFHGINKIEKVTIGNEVTSIGYSAFRDCSGLTSVTIPNSVTYIGGDAFNGCSGLTSVISKMVNPCEISKECFTKHVFYNTTLYVPKGTKEKYRSTDYWSKFVFIEEGEPDTPTSAKAVTESIPVLISANNGSITVKSEANGQSVAVYSVEGQLLGNTTVSNGQATVSTTLQNGNVAVVKVGNKSVKVLMQ